MQVPEMVGNHGKQVGSYMYPVYGFPKKGKPFSNSLSWISQKCHSMNGAWCN